VSLTDFVRFGNSTTPRQMMWPTPAARDYRYPNARSYEERGGGKKGEQLPNAIGGPLNPEFVEWLMGYAIGWTDCEPSATPSSRRSRKSSGEQSCPQSPPKVRTDKAE
jgi:DNA (cytosine-5)-methyltransferase 1